MRSSPYYANVPQLFFDESGYTGGNLLDLQTPYYACASLNITEARAIALKNLYFPGKFTELKFSDLKKGENFSRIHALVNGLLKERSVRVTVIDKRFALSAKLFELVAEPSLSGNIGVYEKGFLPQTVNTFHTLAHQEQRSTLRDIHEALQAAVKCPHMTEVKALIAALENLTGIPRIIANSLLIRPLQQQGSELFNSSSITEGLLGILLSAAWQNLLRWGAVIPVGAQIDVVYDQHSVMAAELGNWRQFTSGKFNMHSNGFDYRLDHPVTTQLGDSKQQVAIQLADLVAGFAAFAVSTETKITVRTADRLPNGLKAWDLLTAQEHAGDQVLLTVQAGAATRFSGWSIGDQIHCW